MEFLFESLLGTREKAQRSRGMAATMRLIRATEDRRAVIPGVAVRFLLKTWRPNSGVERRALVIRGTRRRIGVARDEVVGFIGADVGGDEHPAGTVLLPSCEQEPTRGDLRLQELQMRGTRLSDDIRRL